MLFASNFVAIDDCGKFIVQATDVIDDFVPGATNK